MIYLIISNIIFLFISIYFIIKYYRLLKNKKDNFYNIVKRKTEEEIEDFKQNLMKVVFNQIQEQNDLLINKNKVLIVKINDKQKEYDNLSKYFNDLEKQGKDRVDKQLQDYETLQRNYTYSRLEKDANEREEKFIKEFLAKKESYNQEEQKILGEIEILKLELNDYKEKQKIINEEILRQRELAEQQTFYTINLTENEIQDIIYLREFENKFSNKEVLNKAIYEAYYKKPLTEMVKRVTKGKEFSGIYKITSINTGEIYIGRAVNISKRWVDHIKSSLGIGTLVSSTLHKRLKIDGCWNFTFEVLEEAPKDDLAKRENYWINFYQSNIYGLNMRKEIADE